MHILIIDPESKVRSLAQPAFAGRGWQTVAVAHRADALRSLTRDLPDLIVVHSDGVRGEASHLCQQLKQNALTAGIPIVLIEEVPPPTWLLESLLGDAVMQAPWEPADLIHQAEMLAMSGTTGSLLDDLTTFPRRRSIADDITRRLLAREIFAVGLLALRETDAYRQDYGRMGLDQFVALVSVLLRRRITSATPVSIGYLDEGRFLVVGAPSIVHQMVGRTVADFTALVPAYYESDALFGGDDRHQVGPTTWVNLHGAVRLIEPDQYDNALQVGLALAGTLEEGQAVLSPNAARPSAAGTLAAD